MKSNKGFTLIELLAVIVVLAIIALIATPMILNTIEDAKKGAAQSSALTYVSECEKQIALNMLTNTAYAITNITNTDFTTNIKGDKPTSVNLTVDTSGSITSGTLIINGYTVTYDGTSAKASK